MLSIAAPSAAASAAAEICARLWRAVEAHSGELSHQDDFTAVVVKRH